MNLPPGSAAMEQLIPFDKMGSFLSEESYRINFDICLGSFGLTSVSAQ
jgi:hypothetical protein